jgi:large subunit ribosomal protein L31
MKEGIHPKWYPNANVVVDGEVVMTVGSTKPEIRVEIWSGTHPFYTGTQRLLDTEGQVDRFMRRLQRREEYRAQQEARKQKPPAATNISIEAMGLGKRAENALKGAEVTIAADLTALLEKGDDALLAISGIGQKALIDIKRFLRAEGIIE